MVATQEPHDVNSNTESATTLGTIVELVRRITQADVISIVNFSFADKTMTWRAQSGFRAHVIPDAQPLTRPLTNRIATQALNADRVSIVDGIGENPNFPIKDFPLHAAEGVRDLAIASLKMRGQTLGALLVGYRSRHQFTTDEKHLLEGLAGLAAVALDNALLLKTAAENECRLRLAQQAARFGTFEWNIQTGVNTWSPELEEMYGLQRGGFKATQSAWEELLFVEDKKRVLSLVDTAFHQDEPVEGEWRVVWPDGTVHWLFGRFQLFKDAAGEPLRLTGVNLDITERKRAEQTLGDSEMRLAGLIESAMDAVISIDADQRIVLFNPAAERMFGCNAADVLGSKLDRFIPESSRDKHAIHIKEFGKFGATARRMGALGAINGLRANSEEFPIEASISYSDASGQKLFTVILRDITERIKAESALRESEQQYRELFENANDIVYTHDLDGNLTSINRAGEILSGYSRAEMMRMNIRDLLLPTSQQSADKMLERKLAGEERTEHEVELKSKDGRVLTLEVSSRLMMRDGQPVGVQGIVRDVSERKVTEITLRESEERARRGQRIWEQTFDAIGEGILVYDSQMKIVRCNARAAELMELHPTDVIGLTFSDAFARLFGKQAADYYLAEEREEPAAFEVRTEGGRRTLVSIFTINDQKGDLISVVTLNDVTRLSEIQEQLGRSRRLASVGQLAAGVAHEINNPLAAITTCAEATMRDFRQQADTKELAETHQWNYYLEEIVRQALRCKEITRGLLDLTRQRQAQRVACDPNLVVKQCAKVALQRTGSAIEFQIDLSKDVGEVATDAAMIRQILDNFLTNAIDAVGDEKGTITVSTRRDGDRIAIEVVDTGCGIPAESLARIFDPFFSMKGPGKGYGLGLAISSTLAESLGGAITVESKVGEGSRFSLWIPRRAPEN